MEQGLSDLEINTAETSTIANVDEIASGFEYFLTRNENNQVVVQTNPEQIAGLNTINRFNIYGLTRNLNNELVPDELPDLIRNTAQVQENTNYVITRDGGNNLIAQEQQELPQNLNTVEANRRYQLTRTNGNVVPIENADVTITDEHANRDTRYIIARFRGNYSLTPHWALKEYEFESSNARLHAQFTVGGQDRSRIVHVINTYCKAVRFGLLHFSLQNQQGLINREYRFELIVNNVNIGKEIVVPGSGNIVSTVVNIENLNIILTGGSNIGLRFVSGNTGNYMKCVLTVDTNT